MLNGLDARQFLARYWQRRLLFAAGAFAGEPPLVSPAELMDLAGRDDVRTRLLLHEGGHWELRQGPFAPRTFRRLPPAGWALLVQDVNQVVPEAAALLERFAFIGQARLDDLMISLAPPGGGVGPHFDSYDVFLIQGMGRRRWRLSRQRDRSLVPDAPVRVLQDFRPTREIDVQPGDLLYLPPGVAHDGIAVDLCMTYSAGFRAPAWAEVGAAFLTELADTLDLPGRYRDPGRAPAREPGRIPADMLAQAADALSRIRWTRAAVAAFLGRYLTEPRAHVEFEPPHPALGPAAFARRALRRGVMLALPTQMLYAGGQVFLNGEALRPPPALAAGLRRLADTRRLPAGALDEALCALLHGWYCMGYLAPA